MKSKPNSSAVDANAPQERTVIVRSEPIELCQLLKFAGLSDSGGEAKQTISEGKVLLNGHVETQKRKKIRVGDRVTLGAVTLTITLS
jgi:ribosome-associated protein